MKKVCYAKYNRTRRPEFQTKTIIVAEGVNSRQVIKTPLVERCNEHVLSMQDKYEQIKTLYKNLKPVSVEIVGEKAVFPYVTGDSIGSILERNLYDADILMKLICEYTDIVFDYNDQYVVDFDMTDGFREVFGRYDGGGQALKVANVDEIFDNFIIDEQDNIHLLDYEWVFDFPIPIEFLKFRCHFYFYVKNGNYMKHLFTIDEYLKILGYSEEQRTTFEEMDSNFQQYVHGKDRKYIYTSNYVKEIHDVGTILNGIPDLGHTIKDLNDQIELLHSYLNERDRLIGERDRLISERDSVIGDKNRQLDEKEARIREQDDLLGKKEALIIMKDGNISDYQKNEEVLNEIRRNHEIYIKQLEGRVAEQDEYIQLLRKMMRNPIFACQQLVKKIQKK